MYRLTFTFSSNIGLLTHHILLVCCFKYLFTNYLNKLVDIIKEGKCLLIG